MMPREKRSVRSEEVDVGIAQSLGDDAMNTMTKPTFRWEWNINTLAVVFGFILSFVAWGYTLSGITERQLQNTNNIAELKASNTAEDARLSALELIQAKAENVDFKISLLEKGLDTVDSRISRVAESYSNQFADFRTQLSSISTQIALVAQSQARLENRSPSSTPNIVLPSVPQINSAPPETK